MEYIKIEDGKESVNLTAKNSRIQLQSVRQYFPDADGLSYTVGSDTYGLEKKKR